MRTKSLTDDEYMFINQKHRKDHNVMTNEGKEAKRISLHGNR
jgi:hypothetical protein